jgi:hypothetical protein
VSTGGSTQTHSNCGENHFYIFDANSGNLDIEVFTAGTAPASDGGTWNGTYSIIYNNGNGQQIMDGDEHPMMGWVQQGAGNNEFYCASFATTNGGQGNKTSAAGWSLYNAGPIYRTTVNYSTPYGANLRGVTGVILKTAPTSYNGNLPKAASLAAMTEGSFFHDTGTNTCYVWMLGGVSPVGVTRLVSNPYLGESIGYMKLAGNELRRLCYTYRNDNVYSYDGDGYANWSPDGKLVTYNCNFGVESGTGRLDLVAVEVPTA